METLSNSREETKFFAQNFLNTLSLGEKAVVVALQGDLGAGKTAFSQCIGELLGISESMQSPTFVIERVYELKNQKWQHLIHIDAYRLESPQELLNLGWEKMLQDKGNLILIEWPERVSDIIPEYAYHIVFSHVTENSRQIRLQG